MKLRWVVGEILCSRLWYQNQLVSESEVLVLPRLSKASTLSRHWTCACHMTWAVLY